MNQKKYLQIKMSDWDIESHRSSHEPMHHWELKKTFMESIKHM